MSVKQAGYLVICEWMDSEGEAGVDISPFLIKDYNKALELREEKIYEEFKLIRTANGDNTTIVVQDDEVYIEESFVYSKVYIKTIHEEVD